MNERIHKLEAAIKPVIAAVRASDKGSLLYSDPASWNPDAHIEITLSVKEVVELARLTGALPPVGRVVRAAKATP